MTQPQWEPDARDLETARVADFARFVGARTGREFDDYHSLWEWSITDLAGFWGALWEYFELGGAPATVLASTEMPGAQWFPGQLLNYVDQIARHARTDRPAIVYAGEQGGLTEISWAELLGRTASFAATLRELGVGLGDRVVGYLPNIPEAVIAFLGAASIGAVWSACGQDYSAKAALDRLGQLEPAVLVTADGYHFGGKTHDKRDDIAALRAGLPTVRATVVVPRLGGAVPDALDWNAAAPPEGTELSTEPVGFAHPLWILFSSGTTGLPKGIVHGHGGVLLEHLKAAALQSDIGRGDVFFWYTSPSWMMWNFQVAGLLVGATIVCYDGSPTYPHADSLFDLAARTGTTVLGTSPGYVLACIKAGVVPRREHDLSALRTIGITGSSLPPSSALWLRDNVGERVQVNSISGGTDVVSAFIGGVRTVPVWPGELSVPFLGAAVDAWDESGRPVRGEVGELVITAPMPSMPVSFWHDPDGTRYRAAYFEMFPGVWRHGDWITVTDHGSIVVHGRSDSTLNRHGIRMGSADIYQAVEQLPEIAEALVIGAEQPDGGYWMPLFVTLAPGAELTDELKQRINATIRAEVSPRHVPDEIIAAPGIPHTRTGKKLEVPIKKLFQGADPDRVVERSAVDNADLLTWYAEVPARKRAT
ncbi:MULTISPECIES: acetoacetate--CoA ligase [Nocardia]|uniref:acetoacetate--CoA ligase n=1 Tax=Nocardia TaxID=1817 RepID=UPI0007E94FC6|nr:MULTISPECIES: acetoacetate--CoA ligase [Nocardia]MBF6274024.1 acetoacetate--CoA ligase [Nocardia nova]OBA46367.1 acetoacetate-CoA ligase [Nocardia sp. 852002-51101_SCH5132738]OBB45763.1 acetoacetate-CoA ligase [Nocardia sp. 852002-51244_SCH5132740]OBF68550.1 acetoacetate-CoA ligase [Mycobacterium sp. 852002-51759_SCH5129042]